MEAYMLQDSAERLSEQKPERDFLAKVIERLFEAARIIGDVNGF